MRFNLRDGMWADLRPHITHGTDREIRRERQALHKRVEETGERELLLDWPVQFTRYFVKDWYVLDPETEEPIPITAPNALDRAPEDIMDALFEESARLWLLATTPNSPTPPSSDASSSEERSEKPKSNNSQTPTPSEMPSS